jgi:hypothetical protein
MDAFYHAFYEQAVLPQFGIKDAQIVWHEQRTLGGDEAAFFFNVEDHGYVLIFEDHGGLGKNKTFIQEKVLEGQDFVYVQPIAQTNAGPSYDGFNLPAPSQYCPLVTGMFTLIRIS